MNAEQIKRGMAWIYRQYNRDRSLLALEHEARAQSAACGSIRIQFHRGNAGMGGKAKWIGRSTPAQVQAKVMGGRQCERKRDCNEMTSCEEAKAYLSQCGLSKLDGDSDGVPYESLCVVDFLFGTGNLRGCMYVGGRFNTGR